MAISQIETVIDYAIDDVWKLIVSFDKYRNWRSDLAGVEVKGDWHFVEYTKKGYATKFTVTHIDPCNTLKLKMENTNMYGCWSGTFTAMGNKTHIFFQEDVTVKKFYLKPFLKTYLKRQQALFVADLINALALQNQDSSFQ